MRALVTAAGIAAAALMAGCTGRDDGEAGRDPGPAQARNVEIGDFRRIELAGAYDVEVKTGSAPGVRVEGAQRELDRLVIAVEGGVLKIHPRQGASFEWSESSKVRIAVTVPALEAAAVTGASDLSIDRIASPSFDASVAGSANVSIGRIEGQSFKGSLTGSGDLEVDALAVRTVEVGIAGSGEAELAGKTELASYTITGAGGLDAEKLDSRDIKLSIAGAGSIEARATGTVTGNVVGAGSARITGGANCEVRKMGSGSIDCS